MALTPDHAYALVPLGLDTAVAVIETAGHTVVGYIEIDLDPSTTPDLEPLGLEPQVTIAADGTRAYVTSGGEASTPAVAVLDLSGAVGAWAQTAVIPLSEAPAYPVAISPTDATTGYVATGYALGDSEVLRLDLTANTVTATIAVTQATPDLPIAPGGSYALLTGGERIAALDLTTGLETEVLCGGTPCLYSYTGGAAFNDAGTRAFVVDNGTNELIALDTSVPAAITEIARVGMPVPAASRGIGAWELVVASGCAYVAAYNSAGAGALDGPSAVLAFNVGTGIPVYSGRGLTGNWAFQLDAWGTPSCLEAVRAPTTTTVAVTPNPATSSDALTVTATVVGSGLPIGNVVFYDDNGPVGIAVLDDLTGEATLALDARADGLYGLKAVYSGDEAFAPSEGATLLTVAPTATMTVVEGAPNPSTFGATVTLTAEVSSGAGTPTGSVEFFEGATSLGIAPLDGSGLAALPVSTLTVGSHTITATYSGDGAFDTSSGTVELTVDQAASTTAASATPNPAAFGSTVTLGALVSGPAGTPTGTVTFSSSLSGVLGSAPLVDGAASLEFTTLLLSIGEHAITAEYSGDSSFTTSTGIAPLTVAPGPSTTIASATPNPVAFGPTVTLGAMVSGLAGTPTGTVTFSSSLSGVLGTAPLVDGAASLEFTTLLLAIGEHTITADYSGDSSFVASSGTAPLTVEHGVSSTMVIATPTPADFGAMVLLGATVSTPAGVPTGSVEFFDGPTSLGTAPVVDGGASISVSTLGVGGHTVTAEYSGDSNFTASSGSTGVTIETASSAIDLVATPSTADFGATVELAATVSSAAGTPTGTVTFVSNLSGPLGPPVLLVSGLAVLPVASLAVGGHTITAEYSGDASFDGSSDDAAVTIETAASATAVVAAPNPATYGDTVTLTATVSSSAGTPTGSVEFFDGATSLGTIPLDGSGVAALPVPNFAAGSHLITAEYSGDSNLDASGGATTLTVDAVALTITAADASKAYGTAATLTGFAASGLVGTDTVDSVTLTSDGAAAGAAVGPHAIVASAAVGSGLGNYTISYVDGTLTVDAIRPAPLPDSGGCVAPWPRRGAGRPGPYWDGTGP